MKKTLKKTLATTLGFTMAASVMCAGTVSAAEKEKEVVSVWIGSWWADEVPRIEAGFEEKYPDIDVQIECLPNNNWVDTAVTAIVGGNAPDVLALDTIMLGTPIGQNLLQPMDDFMEQYGWSTDDFSSGVMNASIVDGITYAIPYRTGPTALFYNKTLFDQAGLDYPTDAMDLETFRSDVEALTDAENGIYGFGIAADKADPANCMSSICMFIYSMGGSFLNEDNTASNMLSEETLAGLKYWCDLYTDGLVPEGCISYGWARDLYPMAQNGQLAMIPVDPVTASDMEQYAQANGFEYGLVTNPGGVDRVGGWHWTVPVGAKNVDGAYKFIDYFLTPEVISAQNIVQPAVKDAQNLGAWGDESYDVFWRDDAQCTATLPVIPQWTEIQNTIITELQNILQGAETVEEGAAVMDEKINAILQ